MAALPLAYPIAQGVAQGAGWAWNGYRAWRAAQLLAQSQRVAQAAKIANTLSKADKKECKGDCPPDCNKMQYGGGGNAFMNKLCKMACECMQDRGGAATNQKCVENKLRKDQGGPRKPETDGGHPEVSHKPNPDGGYDPVMSGNRPGEFSNAPVVRGAPRPDISYYEGGKLTKIIEMKFPKAGGGIDGQTAMQADGLYEKIAKANGLDPKKDVVNVDVDKDCTVPGS